jgi:hypothetical protein
VQTYLLPLKPDLVLIGGISQGKDYAAIRDVDPAHPIFGSAPARLLPRPRPREPVRRADPREDLAGVVDALTGPHLGPEQLRLRDYLALSAAFDAE